ncbi:hypothetical protein BDV26DRAFT_255698 [Aspergillus bertholletiae]|uniref:Uncharacterized protein n=1 Tax=Aspergillus bertholletiae TaxID=1226010 RepID=A0A5N7BHL2_9EURO|nr:hypothetical protein BDV26DRAFT_255698 [Aspergillus bertholletiae]
MRRAGRLKAASLMPRNRSLRVRGSISQMSSWISTLTLLRFWFMFVHNLKRDGKLSKINQNRCVGLQI